MFNARLSGQIPRCIARPNTREQLRVLLERAHEHELKLDCRGGGAGAPLDLSSARMITLDLSAMRQVEVEPDTRTARVLGGALTHALNERAAQSGLAAALPRFGGVGVIGASLGGGTGLLSRTVGLSAQQLISATLMLADGRTLEVDAAHELMWALRGAGHLGFGVVLAATIKLHPVPLKLWGGVIRWPLAKAPEVLARLGPWAQALGSRLGLFVTLANHSPAGPCVEVFGAYFGEVFEGQRAFGALAASVLGGEDMTQETTYLALSGAFAPRPLAPLGFVWQHGALKPGAALGEIGERVVRCMTQRPQAMLRYNFEALGHSSLRGQGPLALYHQRADDTAAAQWACVGASIWTQGVERERGAAQEAMSALEQAVSPGLAIWGGHPNYHDPWRPKPMSFYFGFSLERLKALKRRYDPNDRFVGMASLPG